jgi:purine-nucleoside phosphorylase
MGAAARRSDDELHVARAALLSGASRSDGQYFVPCPLYFVLSGRDLMSDFETLKREALTVPIRAAIILGSGMGNVARRVSPVKEIGYADVPGMTLPSVSGHSGRLVLGDWVGKRVLLFEGRLHFYEGHPWDKVTQPVRLAHQLGARVLLLTNAAGGIHDELGPGSLMVLRDHLEWNRPHVWKQSFGPTRPSPYSDRLVQLWLRAASEMNLELLPGVYAAVTGPCYETPAEIRALRSAAADAVGMSTAREVQTGDDLGMECTAISLITNRAAGLSAGPIQHEEVLTTAAQQAERLTELMERFLGLL